MDATSIKIKQADSDFKCIFAGKYFFLFLVYFFIFICLCLYPCRQNVFTFETPSFGMSWHGKGANIYLQNAHFKYRWSEVSKPAILAGSSWVFWGVFSEKDTLHCST